MCTYACQTDLSVQPGLELAHTDVGAGFGCCSSICSEPHYKLYPLDASGASICALL